MTRSQLAKLEKQIVEKVKVPERKKDASIDLDRLDKLAAQIRSYEKEVQDHDSDQ